MTDNSSEYYNIQVFHNDLQPELVLESQIMKVIDECDRNQNEKLP